MMNLRGNNGLEGRATELFNGLLRLTNEPTVTTIGETKSATEPRYGPHSILLGRPRSSSRSRRCHFHRPASQGSREGN